MGVEPMSGGPAEQQVLTVSGACSEPSGPAPELIFASREMTATRPFAIETRAGALAVIGQVETGEGGYRLAGALSRPASRVLIVTVRPEAIARGQRIPHLYGYEALVRDLGAGAYRVVVRHADTSGKLGIVWDGSVTVP